MSKHYIQIPSNRFKAFEYFSVVFIFLFFVEANYSQSNLTLPTYKITIAPADLSSIYSNPNLNDYYPAHVTINDTIYECEIRFRGSSARTLPKKSWKMRFSNNDNPFNSNKINFNAEYRDRSIMRNFLTTKLFEFGNQPTPEIDFVNLFVNNEYQGVYSQVEELEDDFLKRNNLQKGSIYKARSHSANFAPIPIYGRYFYTWDKQEGIEGDYTDIMQLFNKLMYYTNDQFTKYIEDDIDLENIINYFAIEFIIAGFDSYTKNYSLFIDKNGKSARLFPWDNDATFGNYWDGNFINEYIYNIDGNKDQNWACLRFNVLFQRLMEYEDFRLLYNEKVQNIITDGFEYLNSIIDSTYDVITHDVHQDIHKGYSNTQFDDEKDKLKYFLNARREFLLVKDLFVRPRIEDIYISNPFPNPNQPILVRVELNKPTELFIDYITDYDLSEGGSDYTVKSLQLFDDGMSQDVYAGDLIYGTIITFTNNFDGVTPIAFRIGKTSYPANGFSYLEYGSTVSYALSPVNSGINLVTDLLVNDIYSYNENQLVEIINRGNKKIDLTYFHLRGDNGHDDFVFPAGVILDPGKKLIVTNNLDLAIFAFPGVKCLEFLSFDININDTLNFFSPANTEINSYAVNDIKTLGFEIVDIVINEINYHSSDSLNSGDWVEFYNPNANSIKLDGWKFKDKNEDNVYTFPASAIISPNGYFVLAQDIEQFRTIHPDVSAMGSFEFGLSNGGETIRLFNEDNMEILNFTYSDDLPWSKNPDGFGYTLELKNPSLDFKEVANWSASSILGGTPGKENSSYVISNIEIGNFVPAKFKLYQNFPNPFNPSTTINYSLPKKSIVKLSIFDPLGREVEVLVDRLEQHSGSYSVNFNTAFTKRSQLSSGLYIYRLETDFGVQSKKMIFLK